MKPRGKRIVIGLALSILTGAIGADYVSAQDLVAKGDELWAKRDAAENVQAAILTWENAVKARPRDDKLWLKIAVGYYWLSELTPESDKKTREDVCNRGLAAAQRAFAINADSVAANYWTMVIQGRLTEAKGILSGFDFGAAIQKSMFVAQKDANFHHAGIYRFWGRVIYYIPPKIGWFFKFRMEDSIANYKRCIQASPNFLESYLYLAEAYLKTDDKVKARQTLQQMINISSDSLPEFAPENRFYQNKAKALLASMK